MKKTKAEIIEETGNFYNSNNRGYKEESGSCVYFDERTGNKCAVGRCIDKEDEYLKNLIGSVDFDTGNISFLGNEKGRSVDLDSILKEEYKGHHHRFWVELQALHDNHIYWDENGLTEKGRIRLEKIKVRWVKE